MMEPETRFQISANNNISSPQHSIGFWCDVVLTLSVDSVTIFLLSN